MFSRKILKAGEQSHVVYVHGCTTPKVAVPAAAPWLWREYSAAKLFAIAVTRVVPAYDVILSKYTDMFAYPKTSVMGSSMFSKACCIHIYSAVLPKPWFCNSSEFNRRSSQLCLCLCKLLSSIVKSPICFGILPRLATAY